MTQSGWKLTLEIITDYRERGVGWWGGGAKTFFTVRETKMCVASLFRQSAKQMRRNFLFFFFLPPLTTDGSFMVAQ